MNTSTMSCQELVELVTSYLDGTISDLDRARFESHLATCRGCTNYLAQMRQTIQLTGALTTESMPDEARDRLLETFRTWKSG